MQRPTLIWTVIALGPTTLACVQETGSDDATSFATLGDDEDTSGDGDGDGDGDGSCGDGVIDPGEECDLGPENSDAGVCTGSCTLAICGDGAVYEQFEECDDGNDVETDDCVSCAVATCGDGVVQAGVEACDDGNDVETDGCTSACTPSTCGDGIVQENEQCDDGDLDDDDECPSSCQLAFCGDGFVQLGVEDCDDGNNLDNDGCVSVFCVSAFCGDGFLHDGMEQCDDGNLDDGDACPTSCAPAFCGDGFTYGGTEECDDGNDVDDDFCQIDCVANAWYDDFETGDLTLLPWMLSGNGNWTSSTESPHEGMYSAASGTIVDDQQSTLQVTLEVPQAGVVQFWHRVSSEDGWDHLEFYIDDVMQNDWSGELPWTLAQYPVAAGNHTFRWVYAKDSSFSENSDRVWIDDIYVGVP